MRRRPVTATWWLLTDADGERYLRHVPRDPWAPASTRGWRNPNAQPMHVTLRRRGDGPMLKWRIMPRPIVHRERVRFGAWEARPSSVVWKPLDLTPFSWAEHVKRFAEAWEKVEWIHAEMGPALAALGTESPDPVPAEGPADSGGSQTYKRAPLWADSPDLAEEDR